ncbi:hypothetical protein F4821DRAFT_281625 [Hypoxylon rubiginosum]|uniref:Uncharacterized protein n=1 Tax=Hypoxylon rubiginosum TaxID=110542 RepID=A0ACC0DE61_9PEZI|nr:hypothetical protein F4821DRAFT_281625 [Hypoxylon rubiginosum]
MAGQIVFRADLADVRLQRPGYLRNRMYRDLIEANERVFSGDHRGALTRSPSMAPRPAKTPSSTPETSSSGMSCTTYDALESLPLSLEPARPAAIRRLKTYRQPRTGHHVPLPKWDRECEESRRRGETKVGARLSCAVRPSRSRYSSATFYRTGRQHDHFPRGIHGLYTTHGATTGKITAVVDPDFQRKNIFSSLLGAILTHHHQLRLDPGLDHDTPLRTLPYASSGRISRLRMKYWRAAPFPKSYSAQGPSSQGPRQRSTVLRAMGLGRRLQRALS